MFGDVQDLCLYMYLRVINFWNSNKNNKNIMWLDLTQFATYQYLSLKKIVFNALLWILWHIILMHHAINIILWLLLWPPWPSAQYWHSCYCDNITEFVIIISMHHLIVPVDHQFISKTKTKTKTKNYRKKLTVMDTKSVTIQNVESQKSRRWPAPAKKIVTESFVCNKNPIHGLIQRPKASKIITAVLPHSAQLSFKERNIPNLSHYTNQPTSHHWI